MCPERLQTKQDEVFLLRQNDEFVYCTFDIFRHSRINAARPLKRPRQPTHIHHLVSVIRRQAHVKSLRKVPAGWPPPCNHKISLSTLQCSDPYLVT